MFRKSGNCRAGRLDFATFFIEPSILHKIKTNIGKIDYKSFVYIVNKNFSEKFSFKMLNYMFNAIFTFVNVFFGHPLEVLPSEK